MLFFISIFSEPAEALEVNLKYESEPPAPLLSPNTRVLPSATLPKIPPALAVKVIASLPVPVDAIAVPPVPAVTLTAVAPVVLPTVIVRAAAPVPISMFCASASFPIPITPSLELSSKTPSASTKNVSSESIVISPVPVEFIAVPAVPELTVTPVAPSTLPIAITSANAPVPIDIVLSPCVPIFIAWSISSLPILIAPADEFNCIAPLPSKSMVVPPDKVVAPEPSSANEPVPSVKVSVDTDVAVITLASTVTAVLVAEPKASVPVLCGLTVIFALFKEVIISIGLSAEISIPPLLTISIASSCVLADVMRISVVAPVVVISRSSPSS